MNGNFFSKALSLVLASTLVFSPLRGLADDIDIFTAGSAGSADNPNILIVLDNTSNWARQSQQWSGGLAQGQSEVAAIKSLLNDSGLVGSGVNLGLFEFVTSGSANDNGGFVRFPIGAMTDANKSTMSAKLDTIYNDINGTKEKRNSNTPYGNLQYDVYNYLTGGDSYSPNGVEPAPYADINGYTTAYTRFKSPLTSSNGCSRTFQIFISNPNSSGPASDDSANKTVLSGLGGNTNNIGLPNMTTVALDPVNVGYAATCQASGSCVTGIAACSDGTYTMCTCDATQAASVYQACSPSGAKRYGVVKTTALAAGGGTTSACSSSTPTSSALSGDFAACGSTSCTVGAAQAGSGSCPSGTYRYMVQDAASTTSTPLGTTSACYTSQPAASATDYATSCAASGVSCSMSSTATSAACASGQRYMVRDKVVATSVVATASCVSNTSSQNPTCPSGASCEWVDLGQGSCSPASKHNFEYRATTTTYTDKGYSLACASSAAAASASGYSCSGVCEINASNTSASALNCPSGSAAYNVAKVTPSSTTNLGYSLACYSSAPTAAVGGAGYTAAGTLTIDSSLTSSGALTCPSSYSAYAVTWPATNVAQSLGYTSNCYASAAEASTADYAASCSGSGVSCAVDSGTSTTDSTTACGSGMSRPMVVGATGSVSTPTGAYSTASNMYLADEWARFMHQTDLNSAASGTQNVTTYTIDVYNKQQNAEHTALMMSMAMQGGGRYFAAKNQDMILDALKQIVAEIQSVNSTFASASLPVNATNRTQNANQVFIGMFRPDPNAAPRWFGNLKQYRVGQVNGVLDLVDKDGVAATNTQTGFIADCAASFWTSDAYYADDDGVKRGYWENVIDGATAISPTPKSNCINSGVVGYSDYPDGPTVEKGAVASVIRRGNNPPTTTTTPTWEVNRTVYTRSGGSLTAFTTGSTGLSSNLVDYTLGKDVNVVGSHLAEQTQTQFQAATASNTVRPSVHGDVVHSRPLPINYGGSSGVVVYYGANDGALRAVDSSTGKELWAFIPPEFNGRLQRLMDNSPLVSYPNLSSSITPTPTKKDYFFDGSIGLAQNADNSKVWIYPTQRRGGRMIYGMDVTTPTAPTIKWRQGCETNSTAVDVNCSSGFGGIGQTWSTPMAAYIKGYSTTTPVVIVGGGYDTCEDDDTASPSCASPKGAVLYIVDADTGALIRSFSTTRSVVADVALADIDGDRYVDYAYVADTGGNIYRINFLAGPDVAGKSATQALTSSEWSLYRVAYTNGGGRKFLFNPGLLPYKGSNVYVAIASGDREHPLETNYPYANVQNRAYVYLDSMSAYNAAPTACDLDSDACSADYTAPSTCDTTKILPGTTPKAWRMALTQYGQGEQAVTSALIVGGMATFSTNRPIPAASGTCGYALGEARGYWLNLLNASGAISASNATCGGDRSATFAGGGLPPSPVLGVVPVDGTPMVVAIGAPPRDGSAASPVKPSRIKPAVSPTRTRKYQYLKVDK